MSGDYTYTVTAQNAETDLMASGWTAPDGMATVTVGGDPVSLTPSGETWLGAWTVPENTPAGNVPVAAEIAATSNYNAANASPAVTDKGAVTATLTPSAGSVTYGDSVTLTASVAKADPGGVGKAGMTVALYLYNKAFLESALGYGSAVSRGLFVIIGLFSLVNWYLFQRETD